MTLSAPSERVLILAGPNGAGKTTFAREYLLHEADCPRFVNADLIADGLSPFDRGRNAIRAGRIMLQLIDEYIERRESFAFETTLASRNFVGPIHAWRAASFRVTLVFLSLSSPELAIARVVERVRQGGHAVAEEVIRRRFTRGRENYERVYRPIVDAWSLYDNSDASPILVSSGSTTWP